MGHFFSCRRLSALALLVAATTIALVPDAIAAKASVSVALSFQLIDQKPDDEFPASGGMYVRRGSGIALEPGVLVFPQLGAGTNGWEGENNLLGK